MENYTRALPWKSLVVNPKAFSFCSAVLATGLLLALSSAHGAPPGWSTWAQVVEQEAAEASPG